ncbi:antirepressor [Rodentibacter genomosp. 2]|uniref:P22AR C-terminal domain-containing protein n=1 Tax=Rodentibacter genomosp. 2 TaxID=1908266 RepID=UPI000986B663|nr:antirepressor [Rodentibacter genomosp. 2]
MTTLTFQTTTLSVINHNSQTYFTAREIGTALGYRNPLGDVSKLYDRHQDEFTPNMTALIDMRTNGGIQKVRIFSLRGCHLIGMLSHTKVAKDFRKWVLDILDKETAEPKQLALPTPERTFTLNLTEQELCDLCWLWKAAEVMRNLLKLIEPALDMLGSRYAGAAHSCSVEYRRTVESAREILLRPTAEIKEQGIYLEENWHRVLHELRKGELNKIY